MIFTGKSIILLTTGTLGLVTGLQYYEYLKRKREYEQLYKSFLDYDLDNLVIEYDIREKNEYEPFRVIKFESLEDFVTKV